MPREGAPLCLIVPGLDNSGPDHWQSLWEDKRDDCRRVDLGCWSEPDRRIWTERLDAALAMTDGPIVLEELIVRDAQKHSVDLPLRHKGLAK